MSFSVRSPWPPGCQRTATRLTPGMACLSCSRVLPTSSGSGRDNPVTLPSGRESGEPLGLPLGRSVFNHEVAALDVTEVTQALDEGLSQLGESGQAARQ